MSIENPHKIQINRYKLNIIVVNLLKIVIKHLFVEKCCKMHSTFIAMEKGDLTEELAGLFLYDKRRAVHNKSIDSGKFSYDNLYRKHSGKWQ